MKLKELKKILNNMSKEQLEQDLIITANDKYESGIGNALFAKYDYYYDLEDDPSQLKTMSELEEEYDNDEISRMELIIKKGDLYIEIL